MKTKAEQFIAARMKRPAVRRAFLEDWNEVRLAARLAFLRQQQGLTQTQVAAKMHTSAAVISRIESGKFGSLRTLKKYADALSLILQIDVRPARSRARRPARAAA
jgi:transcriptional regulator with XRE-family HTH domain